MSIHMHDRIDEHRVRTVARLADADPHWKPLPPETAQNKHDELSNSSQCFAQSHYRLLDPWLNCLAVNPAPAMRQLW